MPEADLLQIKIDQAKSELPKQTLEAIDAVPWRDYILAMRERKGLSYEQLADLEVETEMILYGLARPENFPAELEKRMKLPKAQVELLVEEMNQFVFKRIREELIKKTERAKMFELVKKEEKVESTPIPIKSETSAPVAKEEPVPVPVNNAPKVEVPEEKNIPEKLEIPSLTAQKLSETFQIPTVKTEHVDDPSLNLQRSKTDPYRIAPEE